MTVTLRLQRANHGAGFRALGLRGREVAELADPFLGVDHAWMSAPTFPPHPHAGFSAVSYVFLDSETGIDNRDSQGMRNRIEPGGLHWTAAARGVVHEEIPAQAGKTVHSLQIFVNLPADRQDEAPFALCLVPEEVPVVALDNIRVRVVAGSFGAVSSPLCPPTPVGILDICLEAGGRVDIPVAAGEVAFVLPIHGAVQVDDCVYRLEDAVAPLQPALPAPSVLRLATVEPRSRAVVFTGRPLGQPIYWCGPAAMASAEASEAAMRAYERGEFGGL